VAGKVLLAPTASSAGKTITLFWYDGSNYGQTPALLSSVPGEARLYNLPSARVSVATVRWYFSRNAATGAWVEGDQFYACEPIAEVVTSSGVTLPGPYFDGDTARAEWTGTPNASPSTLWSAG